MWKLGCESGGVVPWDPSLEAPPGLSDIVQCWLCPMRQLTMGIQVCWTCLQSFHPEAENWRPFWSYPLLLFGINNLHSVILSKPNRWGHEQIRPLQPKLPSVRCTSGPRSIPLPNHSTLMQSFPESGKGKSDVWLLWHITVLCHPTLNQFYLKQHVPL